MYLPTIFDGLSDDETNAALALLQEVTVDAGTTLMEEGDQDPSMIFVVAGELRIQTGGVVLGEARSDDLVGEMALFAGGVRTANVQTRTEAHLLFLDRSGYHQLRDQGHALAMRLERRSLELLVQRLSVVDAKIGSLAQGTPVEHTVPTAGFFSRIAALFGGGGDSGEVELDGAEVLGRSALFREVRPAVLHDLARHMAGLAFRAGHFLCTEGAPGLDMYILAQGEVDVTIATEGDRSERVATLEPGDAFGIMALVQDRPRTASCIAREPVQVLALDRERWDWISGQNSPTGSAARVAMIRALAEQLAYANAQLALLDVEKQRQQFADLKPLMMASGAMEAHSAQVREADARW